MLTQRYRLDMVPGGVPIRVPVSRYDSESRDILFELYNGAEPFSVPAGSAVTCDGTKPDCMGFTVPATFTGNTVTVTVTEQMSAVAGDARCQITINKDGAVLGSANFILVVEREALGESTNMSESDITAIIELNRDANTAAKRAETAAKEIEESSASFVKSVNGKPPDENGNVDVGTDAAGKSAYETAVEGGYTGTESEFAAKLAAEIPTDEQINTLIDTKLGATVAGNTHVYDIGSAAFDIATLDFSTYDAGDVILVVSDSDMEGA